MKQIWRIRTMRLLCLYILMSMMIACGPAQPARNAATSTPVTFPTAHALPPPVMLVVHQPYEDRGITFTATYFDPHPDPSTVPCYQFLCGKTDIRYIRLDYDVTNATLLTVGIQPRLTTSAGVGNQGENIDAPPDVFDSISRIDVSKTDEIYQREMVIAHQTDHHVVYYIASDFHQQS